MMGSLGIEWLHNSAQSGFYRLSLIWHCHQLQSRSFFIRGRQIPLCSRCLGILLGFSLLPVYQPMHDWRVSVVFVALCLLDGVSQLWRLRKSNNLLRLCTGAGFSVGISSLTIGLIKCLLNIRQ